MTPVLSSDARDLLERTPRELLLGDGWAPGTSGSFAVEDPDSGAVVAEVADAGRSDAEAAIAAVWDAQGSWGATPAWVRADVLRRTHERLLSERDRFAMLLSVETGKPLAEARAEVDYSADFLRVYSELGPHAAGRYQAAPNGGMRLLTNPQPLGPCLLICPWNLPLAMVARKVAPAIAAGCTFIVKPARQTPLATLAFAELLIAAGLPTGACAVLPTTDPGTVVQSLLGDERVRKLSFTGSTEVGRGLLRLAADGVKRTSMELGGNAPLIVFADCDLEHAVQESAVAKLRNAGQSCIAANRIYVERPIAAEFGAALAARLKSVKIGREASLGPMIDAPARTHVAELVDSALSAGGDLLTGGGTVERPGYYYEPTLVAGVRASEPLLTEEVFGPACALVEFDREEEAVELANSVSTGLVAYVFCSDLDRVLRLSDELDSGMVGVNRGVVSSAAAPFGGTKVSGLGREGGEEGLREYQETKYVCIDGGASAPRMRTGASAA